MPKRQLDARQAEGLLKWSGQVAKSRSKSGRFHTVALRRILHCTYASASATGDFSNAFAYCTRRLGLARMVIKHAVTCEHPFLFRSRHAVLSIKGVCVAYFTSAGCPGERVERAGAKSRRTCKVTKHSSAEQWHQCSDKLQTEAAKPQDLSMAYTWFCAEGNSPFGVCMLCYSDLKLRPRAHTSAPSRAAQWREVTHQ